MHTFCYILGTFSLIGNTILGFRPMPLSNEINVPKDAVIERLSKKISITECTIQCLHHPSTKCCGVGFFSEEMVNNGVWDTFTCFLLKKFECLSSNNGIIRLKVKKMTTTTCLGEQYPDFYSLPKDKKSAKTSQSSSHNGLYSEEKAVDGVYISDLNIRPCQHTSDAKPNEASWWQIEYKHPVLVHSVELYNRMDCCGERLSNVNIFILKDGVNGAQQHCGTTDADMATKKYIKIICSQALEGNIIRIESPLGGVITLCEVDINGAFIEDEYLCQQQYSHDYISVELKDGRSATLQSDNVAESVALKAIDGEIVQLQPNENCAYTTNSLGSWIKIHYDKKIILHRIQVYTDFYINGQQSQIEAYIRDSISMNEELCGVFNDFRDGEQTINFVNFLIGNDVKFIKTADSHYTFILCEVKIFGRYL